MSRIDILVPDLPESIIDATVAAWHKKIGESVQRNEVLVEIETDKVVLEIPAPETGILEDLLEEEGSTVVVKQVLGRLRLEDSVEQKITKKSQEQKFSPIEYHSSKLKEKNNNIISPSIRRLIAKYDLNIQDLESDSVSKRISRENIEKHMLIQKNDVTPTSLMQTESPVINNRSEKYVPMTRLRKRVAERLLKAKNSMAMLTTFNEVNMQSIINLRKRYGEAFEKKHGIRLGFMSFYVKAVLEALRHFPEINAAIDGEDIVYHNYFDISIAVSTPRGLVTPVLRDINVLCIADIEKKIKELANKGRDGKLKVEELIGGNFTITNGGIFGSLMSTPIINPPQSAILGIHIIKDRPMAINGQVIILPMMYLALSYDHRLIDGKESVSFLVMIKEILEEPIRLLLDV